MYQKSAIIYFPKSLIDQPIIYRLIKTFDVEVNILQASITHEADGRMFAIFSGKRSSVEEALDYLTQNHAEVTLPAKNLTWHEDLCVHCSACVSQCPSRAFTINAMTACVEFDAEKCIGCELCIPSCFYGAVESISEHLKRKGAF